MGQTEVMNELVGFLGQGQATDEGANVRTRMKRGSNRARNDVASTQTYLHKRSLNLSIGRGTLGEPSTSDRINLVHENDARLVLASVRKHLSDQPSGFTNVLVNNLPKTTKKKASRMT